MTKTIWTIIHDILIHPICGLFWIIGLDRQGNWLHDKTVHPLNYEDETWFPPNSAIKEAELYIADSLENTVPQYEIQRLIVKKYNLHPYMARILIDEVSDKSIYV